MKVKEEISLITGITKYLKCGDKPSKENTYMFRRTRKN